MGNQETFRKWIPLIENYKFTRFVKVPIETTGQQPKNLRINPKRPESNNGCKNLVHQIIFRDSSNYREYFSTLIEMEAKESKILAGHKTQANIEVLWSKDTKKIRARVTITKFEVKLGDTIELSHTKYPENIWSSVGLSSKTPMEKFYWNFRLTQNQQQNV
jgi:hypothetical protein